MNLELPTDIVIYSIEKAIKSYRKMAQNNFQNSQIHITIDQAQLLILLKNRPELTQVEMAEILFKDIASVTRMIELMVKNDFLSRSEHIGDRRRKELSVSSKGVATIKKLLPIIQINRNTALEGLSEAEINQLDKLLKKITYNCT
ncbi:MarR family transcriptional regulator [Algoriphagus sp. D3-2-R+10]|uniref:MarR family winged helix-turn-helix transcriptional regulator n=1 Tax=Algoriphagus aurantiacus TaxID=3103948 RepID=UPI002B3F2E46|nr:MarR family transcriptional regulator [Algoriphagus sp. D3-2-R+10]MEB2774621.1 MarR family transcriptional regulator [Algoriphagus sp. D3-2-R+10]